MKLLFWLSLSLIFFAYGGYPICLYVRSRFWPRPVQRATIFPSVTIVLAVYNEEKNLPHKLRNLAALDYPAERLEVIVVSDGSLIDKSDSRCLAGFQPANGDSAQASGKILRSESWNR